MTDCHQDFQIGDVVSFDDKTGLWEITETAPDRSVTLVGENISITQYFTASRLSWWKGWRIRFRIFLKGWVNV